MGQADGFRGIAVTGTIAGLLKETVVRNIVRDVFSGLDKSVHSIEDCKEDTRRVAKIGRVFFSCDIMGLLTKNSLIVITRIGDSPENGLNVGLIIKIINLFIYIKNVNVLSNGLRVGDMNPSTRQAEVTLLDEG